MENITAFISLRMGTCLLFIKVQTKFTTDNNFTFGAIFSAELSTYGEGNNTNIDITQKECLLHILENIQFWYIILSVNWVCPRTSAIPIVPVCM